MIASVQDRQRDETWVDRILHMPKKMRGSIYVKYEMS